MPDVARVLKDEITRLAKKEAKQATQPLLKQVRELKVAVRKQSQQIGVLQKEFGKKQDKIAGSQTTPEVPEDTTGKDVRIPKGSIRKYRDRFGLSQKEMGLLLGVSALTISQWELDKAAPRGQNRLAFAGLRKMKAREVKEKLEKLAAG